MSFCPPAAGSSRVKKRAFICGKAVPHPAPESMVRCSLQSVQTSFVQFCALFCVTTQECVCVVRIREGPLIAILYFSRLLLVTVPLGSFGRVTPRLNSLSHVFYVSVLPFSSFSRIVQPNNSLAGRRSCGHQLVERALGLSSQHIRASSGL